MPPETQRPSVFRGLWPRDRREPDAVADQALDEALERLAHSLQQNVEVCAKVRRRQSSGSIRIVTVPPTVPEAE